MNYYAVAAETSSTDRVVFTLIVFAVVYAILIGISFFVRWRTNQKFKKLEEALAKADPLVEELRKLSELYENSTSDEEREKIQVHIDDLAEKINLILDEAIKALD